MGWIGLLTAAFQIIAELIKIRAEHAQNLGVPKLPPEQRKLVDNIVVDAVRTRDTSDLEALLKGKEPIEEAPQPLASTGPIVPANSGAKSS